MAIIASAILCIPVIVVTVTIQIISSPFDFSLSTALWELRATDVLAQGLVVLTAALGVGLFLEERRRK